MKIYVGNLSYETTEKDLKDEFAAYGETVSVDIVKDRYSGQSRGFGFVEMADDNAGQTAISELHNKELKGRNMNISEARPQSKNTGGGFSGGRRDSGGGSGGGGGDKDRRGSGFGRKSFGR